MYRLEYLPIALQDMVEIVQYISKKLSNPTAAHRLSNRLIEAGESIAEFPYSNPVYLPIKPLKHEYRKLLVGNYLMFYWVDENNKLITISRIIYAGRDSTPLLE